MRDTRVSADDLRAAIERTGYYPGLVTDAVWSSLGPEPVQAYVVQHDAIFDPGMEVRLAHHGPRAHADPPDLLPHRRASR